MKSKPNWTLFAAVLSAMNLSYGCTTMRITGYSAKALSAEKTAEPVDENFTMHTLSRAERPRVGNYEIPAISTATQELTAYYSDLGPDTLDVSMYPPRQRHNYAVFKMACSQCHSLARAINAPTASRRFWELYVTGMRFNTYFSQDKKIEKDDIQSILDFLEYDSNIRKREHRSDFEELQTELKQRYKVILEERIRRLQQGRQPIILRGEQP